MKLLLEYKVPPNEDGFCAEHFLKKRLGISAGLLCELKYSGKIFINGKVCRTVDAARCGNIVSADVYEDIGGFGDIKPFETDLDIIYEDDYILVVNKNSEMESHPCHSNYETTLGNAVVYHWSKNGEYHNYHIVNRLDRGTSGLSVIAKNRFSHNLLSQQIKSGEFKKYYQAIVHGRVEPLDGIIELSIERCGTSIIKRCVSESGKYAKTLYKTVDYNGKFSLVDISLETGRTHQIRVHFSHIGHPLVGDWLYGTGDNEKHLILRHALHAKKIELFHPATKKPMVFDTKLPDDMENLIK